MPLGVAKFYKTDRKLLKMKIKLTIISKRRFVLKSPVWWEGNVVCQATGSEAVVWWQSAGIHAATAVCEGRAGEVQSVSLCAVVVASCTGAHVGNAGIWRKGLQVIAAAVRAGVLVGRQKERPGVGRGAVGVGHHGRRGRQTIHAQVAAVKNGSVRQCCSVCHLNLKR